MMRSSMIGAGIFAVLLAGGVYVWSHRSGPALDKAPQDVRVVRGSGTRPATAASPSGERLANDPAAAPSSMEAAKHLADDPELQAALPDPKMAPTALYSRVRAEPRDADWAPRSERSIRAALTAVPYMNADDLRVSCAATLCEVRGALANGLSDDNANVAMAAIQGPTLQSKLGNAGLQPTTTVFGSGARPGSPTFTMYTQRR